MSSTGLAGTARISPASTFEVVRWNSAGFAKPDEIWQSLSFSFFMTGAARERLQNHRPGCSLAPSSMNDFPMPEDPPVTVTAENIWSAARGEDTRFERKFSVKDGWSVLTLWKPKHNAVP